MDESNWPTEKQKHEPDEESLEIKKHAVLIATNETVSLPDVRRFSTWTKLIRTTAWMIRFVRNCRKAKTSGPLKVEELKEAEIVWIRKVQLDSFPAELTVLKSNKKLSKSSTLYACDPHIDEHGLMKISGRLFKANLPVFTKEPVILPAKHEYTRLMLQKFHIEANHCGMETVANEVRQRFWIPKLRMAVRRTWNDCQICKNRRTKPTTPKMGELPEARVKESFRPFASVGMDYFGPLTVKSGQQKNKVYGVIFTCLATRAIHLEVASSLSTDSCVMAIRRMISRRGHPGEIYSDNGTNLRGGDLELKNAVASLDQSYLWSVLSAKAIHWHFNPPSCPHMGGAWERLIRTVKNAMRVVLQSSLPSEETLNTILVEIEAIVNSSPLTFVSLDHHDDEALTPNHFLLGHSSPALCPGNFNNILITRKNWIRCQQLANHFWARWTKEYLPTLTRRTKWLLPTSPIDVGSVVIIVDSALPRGCWPKGIVTNTFPGRDGIVRVAEVKTQFGLFRRPVAKLAKLDVQQK